MAGKVKTVVSLPTDFTGAELVHTTREALAAGLSYTYEERPMTLAAKP